MRYRTYGRDSYWDLNAKSIFLVGLTLSLFFSLMPVRADWEDDANARIESNRKRDVQITVVDQNGSPLNNVDVQIEQVRHNFGFGTCLEDGQVTNTNHQNFIVDHFEWATCENDMKWSSNESTRDVWTFSQADTIANFCADNDIKLRGHTLVWETGSQTPAWVSGLPCETYPTASEMLEEIDERIDYTVGRYAGQIVQWDVDNEMLSGSMFDCLGEAGRAHFFQEGNSVDPNCGFYMNEYSNNSFGGYDGDAYAARALGLISLGGPVEGLGIQAHVASPFNPELYYSDVLEELAVVGVPIIATEYDSDAGSITQAADDLENLYRICFSHPSVEGIIMWGYDSQSVWRGSGIVNASTWVLNEAGVRYEALLDEWTTNTSDTTEPNGVSTFRGFHGIYEITCTAGGAPNELFVIDLEPGTGTAEFVLPMDIGPQDITPPSPDPMEWASEPNATGPTSITMTASEANDNNPPVQYYFECTTNNDANSNWRTNPTYVAQGLVPDTEYTFKVKARDSSTNQNQTAFSDPASAITDPPDLIPPDPDPMEWAAGGQPSAVSSTSITMTAETATDDGTPPVEYYFGCTTDSDANSTWQSDTTYVAQGLEPLTQYTFKVKARDSAPALNKTDFSSPASATTDPPPTDIEILGDWVEGTSHTAESGYSRALIFIAHAEENGDVELTSVTYGGQSMTKVIDEVVGTSYQAYATAFILDEAGIAAASNSTFTVNWNVTPDDSGYSSVFLGSVDQTEPIGDSDTNSNASSSPTTIATDPLSTNEGDMVFVAATCGNENSNYTINNGFTEAIEHDMGSSTGSSGYKSATGADETPSVTNNNLNRQVIIGFVIQSVPSVVDYPPAAPTGLVATGDDDLVSLDWNDNSEADLEGYNVYRSGYSGGGYSKINPSLVVDSDYVDNDVDNFEDYYYVVTAVDANDNKSGYSNEDAATPDLYQNCTEVQTGGDGLVSDLTGDCYVNLEDLDIIVEYWLDTNCGASGNCQGADFAPVDGDVDLEDFSDFAVDWMQCNDPEDSGCIKNWWPAE